jgi:hypothetical protein
VVLTTHPLLVPRSGQESVELYIYPPSLRAFESVTEYLYLYLHAMKEYGRWKARLHLFLNSALGWSGQVHASAAVPLRTRPHYPLGRNFCGFKSCGSGREIIHLSSQDSNQDSTNIHPVPHPSTTNIKFIVSYQMIIIISE